MLNIVHPQTTAYHPESNSAVERLHRRLKDALRARAAMATWADELPFVLLGLLAQPREDADLSPAESVFGAPTVLGIKGLFPLVKNYCQMSFCSLMSLLLNLLLKIFKRL